MFKFIRDVHRGNRFADSLLSGRFRDSPEEQPFALWFAERPERSSQRDIFVQLTLKLRCPSGVVAERLLGCIMKVWRKDGSRFGDLPADQLDELIEFGPAKAAEQAEAGRVAFERIKAGLRSLDQAPAGTE